MSNTITNDVFWAYDDNGWAYSMLERLWMDGYFAGKNEANGLPRTSRRDDVTEILDWFIKELGVNQ